MMKKLMCIALAASILVLSGCDRTDYSEVNAMVEKYLRENHNMYGRITKTRYEVYEIGASGGQRHYYFKFETPDHEVYEVSYTDFPDISEETMSDKNMVITKFEEHK